MTLELFEKIKEIVDEIFQKIKKDFKLTINDDEKIIVYYNIYLTSYGIRTGTFIDNFSKFLESPLYISSATSIDAFITGEKNLFKYITPILDLALS